MNIEYKNCAGSYPIFFESVKHKIVTVACDINTKPYADNLFKMLEEMDEEGYKRALLKFTEMKNATKEELLKALYTI